MGHGRLEDGLIVSLTDPFSNIHMGVTAENIAEKFNISRLEQDELFFIKPEKSSRSYFQGII